MRGGRGGGGGRGGRGGGHFQQDAKSSKGGARPTKTNRAKEAKRFSTIQVPKKAEVKSSNLRPLAPEMRAGGGSSQQKQESFSNFDAAPGPANSSSGSNSSNAVFDPIPNDGMFEVVQNSQYWPPKKLKFGGGDQDGSRGGGVAADVDQYDRQEDEKRKRKEIERTIKDQRKANPGELVHPRGKAPQNKKLTFDDDDGDDESE